MDAGFVDLVCFPSLVTLDRPGGSIWSNRHFGKGVGKHHCSAFPTHQPHRDIVIPRIGAQNAMTA